MITSEILKELEDSYHNWKNVEDWKYKETGRMSFIFKIVIKHSNGNYYSADVEDYIEELQNFDDLVWQEVYPKEITAIEWVIK